jgi:hypothetical protein
LSDVSPEKSFTAGTVQLWNELAEATVALASIPHESQVRDGVGNGKRPPEQEGCGLSKTCTITQEDAP